MSLQNKARIRLLEIRTEALEVKVKALKKRLGVYEAELKLTQEDGYYRVRGPET